MLLPDGRVLSAGGGEFRPFLGRNKRANNPIDTHRGGQLFSPPYLFNGPRPEIVSAPDAVVYGQTFDVEVNAPNAIARVTWLGLSSVTQSINMTQRFAELGFTVQNGILQVSAPSAPLHCPPGHYLLFVLNDNGVPSVAEIVRIKAPPVQSSVTARPNRSHCGCRWQPRTHPSRSTHEHRCHPTRFPSSSV